MTRRTVVVLAFALVGVRGVVAHGQPAATAEDRWAPEIAKFAAADAAMPFAPGGVVFVGSSSIRMWDLASSFPGQPVLNRGFGGTQIGDSVRYVERLVIAHKPRAVVFYAGDNDLFAGRTPKQVQADFRAFVGRVHAALPATRIAFIGIKPSIARWAMIDKVREANRRIRTDCDRDDRLAFVDVDAAMLGWDARPRPELFIKDGLHMSPAGYEIWNLLVRPFID